jgi:hypothetical protein
VLQRRCTFRASLICTHKQKVLFVCKGLTNIQLFFAYILYLFRVHIPNMKDNRCPLKSSRSTKLTLSVWYRIITHSKKQGTQFTFGVLRVLYRRSKAYFRRLHIIVCAANRRPFPLREFATRPIKDIFLCADYFASESARFAYFSCFWARAESQLELFAFDFGCAPRTNCIYM